ncbi:nucleotidyltransferase family protein [Methylotetracoccus oryzae]|uniref:nucleotidyltransferase family protein n=1 Tax=Methylotetracoccus oryzae TaxID=1919059 RepID=UPI001F3B6FBA|nr:nucleotidyltransferase family protein [Methylotetracoccus oryzae]
MELALRMRRMVEAPTASVDISPIEASMKPSLALELHREDIRRIVERNDARNPRVFGSVARGEDTEASDLDLLVDPIDGRTTLISLVRMKRELEQALGVRADVVTPNGLRDRIRQGVLADATAV